MITNESWSNVNSLLAFLRGHSGPSASELYDAYFLLKFNNEAPGCILRDNICKVQKALDETPQTMRGNYIFKTELPIEVSKQTNTTVLFKENQTLKAQIAFLNAQLHKAAEEHDFDPVKYLDGIGLIGQEDGRSQFGEHPNRE